jgi:hypothetical protein
VTQWSKPSSNTSSCTKRILKELSTAKFDDRKRYLALCTKVSKSLNAFACATPEERKACVHFAEARTTAHVQTSNSVPKSNMSRPRRYSGTPKDYSESVNVMYDTLRSYSRCKCQPYPSPNGIAHEAKLCLRSPVRDPEGLVIFDLHLSSQPDWVPEGKNIYWQQLRLHVPRYVSSLQLQV